MLKTIHKGNGTPDVERQYMDLTGCFWDAYLKRIATGPWQPESLVSRAIDHAAACLLARVDGKSPVEYLDRATQTVARRLALEALRARPQTWAEMLSLLDRQLHQER